MVCLIKEAGVFCVSYKANFKIFLKLISGLETFN